jgi:hypothetical protein
MSPDLTVVPDVERELDRLYGLPLDEFTAARNDLAKRLRKAGDKDGAERVAKLRKPSITAWAINQAARGSPDEIQALIDAGRELFEAQKAALGGKAGDRFEAAQTRQRDAVRVVVRTSRSILEESGHAANEQAAERIAATLRAASVDEAGQQLLEKGRFDEDFEGGGMLLLAGLTPSVPRPPRTAGSSAKAKERPPARRKDELAAARQALREAQAVERETRRSAERAEKDAGRAREEADDALAAADQAEQHAAAARAQAAAAAEGVDKAQERLKDLQ